MKRTNYIDIHFIAQCVDCNFSAAIQTEAHPTKKDVVNAARKHVRATGHTVRIERGSVTKYEPSAH